MIQGALVHMPLNLSRPPLDLQWEIESIFLYRSAFILQHNEQVFHRGQRLLSSYLLLYFIV